MAKFRPQLEALEDRMLPSNIIWINRGTPSDKFTGRKRTVVDQAIVLWENQIENFNSETNELELFITGGSRSRVNLGGGRYTGLGTFNSPPLPTAYGRPRGAVTIDADGGGFGWYVDPKPANNTEFRRKHTKYHLSGGPARIDLLSVVVHEIGHVLGLSHIKDKNDVMNPSTITGHRYLPSPRNVQFLADRTGVTVKAPLAPKVSFVANWYDGDYESKTSKQIKVVLSAIPTTTVTVSYAVTGGTATNGTDYQLTNGSLTFAPGEYSKVVPLTIVDDADVDSGFTESIQVTLYDAVGAALWAPFHVFTYEILDNDF